MSIRACRADGIPAELEQQQAADLFDGFEAVDLDAERKRDQTEVMFLADLESAASTFQS